MPLELGEKWGTVCLNTRLPLSTLMCAEYSVMLIYLFIKSTKKPIEVNIFRIQMFPLVSFLLALQRKK